MYIDFYKRYLPWIVAFILAVFIVSGYRFLFSPPSHFPSGSIIIVPKGLSTPLVAQELKNARVIASPTLFRLILRISGNDNSIQAGAYRFQTPQNLFRVVYRIVTGDYGIPLSRITFVEGVTISEAAKQVAETFSPMISEDDFLKAGESYEGYLFPDTYFFSLTTDAESVVKIMRENFNKKIEPFSEDIKTSGHSLSDIVTMASLIEKETKTDADRHIVSGILWTRFSIGMPLQVDVSLETYDHPGFPSAPIANPGIESIDAAIHPTKTNYLYYLTGKDGLMHYATTFAAHQVNRKKYLD